MKPRLPDSHAKLALLSVLCSLIVCLALLIPWSRVSHSRLFGAYLLLCIVVVPVCAILSLKFATDLRHGVENEDWTEAQLEPLRTHFESRYCTALSIGLSVAFFILEFPLKRRFGGLGWGCFLFSQIIFQLRIALKRRPAPTPPNQWDNPAPIHSDQWGKR